MATRHGIAATLFTLLGLVASVAGVGLSPITRIVDLLKDLSEHVEAEGKTEQELYQKYMCWATSNVEAKTQSNTKAQSRSDSLKTYISDLDAGRIELTTERVDLEKELAQLTADLETAAGLRAKENGEFESAKTEMEQAIAALTQGLKVLGEATAPQSLIATKGKLGSSAATEASLGFSARVAEASTLARAADLADRALSRADARFLRRVLTGDVPTVDWKKLNRKATFKKTYKARSGDIMATLEKLKKSFEKNLAEATKKEEDALALYEKLADAKGKQKSAAEESLVKMEKEGGARGLSKAQAQEEVDDLTAQIADDTKFISELQSALDTKKGEWEARSQLRTQELAAISKAISILHSDDARDMFKRSLASQGYFFLETNQRVNHRSASVAQVSNIFRRLPGASASKPYRALSKRVTAMLAAGGSFDKVITAIESMVQMLSDEEKSELETKEKCESDRDGGSRSALVASRSIDDMTDTIAALTADIKDIVSEIEEKTDKITSIEEEMKKATELRKEQAKEHAAAKADDEEALSVLGQATQVLETFYKDNGLMLVSQRQCSAAGKASQAPAGEAPPPPPSTWDSSYGGKTGESTGIISLLKIAKEDIEKDIAKADAEEDQAIASYDELMSDQQKAITDLQAAISDLQGTKSQKEGTIGTTETERGTKKDELAATLKMLKDIQPGCDFVAVNFDLRSKNRQSEIDGLHKAKAILQGADFSAAKASLTQRARAGIVQAASRRLAVRPVP